MNTQSIKVNGQEIMIIADGLEKYVAIKPICEALGVDYSTQLNRLKEDEILASVMGLRPITGADGKTYEMRVLPIRFVFGWLFTINPKNVKPEVKNQVIAYRMECYNALFDTFTKRTSILKEKSAYQLEIERLEEELKSDEKYLKIQALKTSMSDATKRLNAMDKDVLNEQLDLFRSSDENHENKGGRKTGN